MISRKIRFIEQASADRLARNAVLPPASPLREAMKTSIPMRQTEAIVAVFDLTGFTLFCSRASPATAIPVFLDAFLGWLFKKMEGNTPSGGPLWREPPFFAKFLGDGVLILWDSGNMAERQIAGLLTTLLGICHDYRREFCTSASEQVNDPPQSLRCRVTRGTVFSINNGRDYVGHCINLAVRLQEYKLLSFCIASTGFDTGDSLEATLQAQLVSLPLPIRGLGAKQPAWVLRREIESLKTGAPGITSPVSSNSRTE